MREYIKIHKVYDFMELGDKAKDKVREYVSRNWDSNDSDMLTESLKGLLEDKLPFVTNTEVAWDLSYDQNSGVAFYGDIDLDVLLEKYPEFELQILILKASDGYLKIQSKGNRSRQFTNNMDLVWGEERPLRAKSVAALDAMMESLMMDLQKVAYELKDAGYKELEWKTSDETLTADAEANGWHFTSAGDFVHDTESDGHGDILEIVQRELYELAQAEGPLKLDPGIRQRLLEARKLLSDAVMVGSL